MRKRAQYHGRGARLKTKIPTLIVMIVALFCILYFGNTLSDRIAELFVPQAAVTDDMAPMQPAFSAESDLDSNGEGSSAPVFAPKSGTVMSQANKNSAQTVLQILTPN